MNKICELYNDKVKIPFYQGCLERGANKINSLFENQLMPLYRKESDLLKKLGVKNAN